MFDFSNPYVYTPAAMLGAIALAAVPVPPGPPPLTLVEQEAQLRVVALCHGINSGNWKIRKRVYDETFDRCVKTNWEGRVCSEQLEEGYEERTRRNYLNYGGRPPCHWEG